MQVRGLVHRSTYRPEGLWQSTYGKPLQSESLWPLPLTIMHHLQSSQVSAGLPTLYYAPLTVFASLCGPSPPLSCTTQSNESSSLTQPSIMYHSQWWVLQSLSALYHAPFTVLVNPCVPSLFSIMHHSQSSQVSWTHIILGAWIIRSSHGHTQLHLNS